MIHRLNIFILFILWCFIGYSQSEGIVQTTRYSPNFNGKQVELLKNKIWFKDSAVIYEFRVEMQSIGSIDKGRIVKTAYPLSAYYYLDLRTMMAQQYGNFKDTAMPMYNINLKSEDAVPFWRFYKAKNARQENSKEMYALADTTIENILYKRIKIPKENSYTIYYLQCNTQTNIFHMNGALEQAYPGCKSFRNEFVYGEKNIVSSVFEYKIISNTLTEPEDKIFNSWGSNAKNTTLPMLTLQEVMSKAFSHNVKFDEEPIITIVPHDSTFPKLQSTTKITQDDIKQWLYKNLSPSTLIKNRLIKKVLQNALFNKMYSENLHAGGKEKLVIIPLKDRPVTQHYTIKNPPLQYLIVVENTNGEIRRGDIILFYPDNYIHTVPKNTFFNLFNSDVNSEDGTYALISLRDIKTWEMDFKNHQKTKFLLWTSNSESKKDRENCKFWYLETTKYLHFGQIEQNKKPLGSTCTGCPPNQLCDKPETSIN